MMAVKSMIDNEQRAMVEKFQCTGCVRGSDINCDHFKLEDWDAGFWCSGHLAGIILDGPGRVVFGLPKGFDRVGAIMIDVGKGRKRSTNIRFSLDPSELRYDKFNIAVWAMEEDGYLFVRSICPRLNLTFVDIIKGGRFHEICPDVIDVAKFIDEIN